MRLRRVLPFLFACACAPFAAAAPTDLPDIPFTRFELPNGLTVVVSEDHKAPVVAVSVWYHVGSSNEPERKTGFAHLFEHLMFQSSENHKDEYFRPFELAGATDQNGSTWLDRTNYYETVPTSALDMALWMESDRMGHLLGAIDKSVLDEQRGVVQNEKRQGENEPYGRVMERLQAEAFPANHPYHHETIGSMADLDAASLDDVKQWFRDYYGASNATVVLVGDITPDVAKAKMLRYFGDVPPGPPVPRQQPWTAPREKAGRGTMEDHVAQARVYREWNAPANGHEDEDELQLAIAVLGGGKTSRLYERLVYKDKLVDSISAEVAPFALASMVILQADVKNGVPAAKVEAAIDDELKKFLREGPTADELARVKVGAKASFIRGLEVVNGKASLLAEGQVYHGDPAFYEKSLATLQAATPESVRAAAKHWLGKPDYVLTVTPAPKDKDLAANDATPVGRAALKGRPDAITPPARELRAVASDIDRSKGLPSTDSFPDITFPTLQHAKLKNGIEVVLAERHTIPVVQMQMLFDAGYAADQGRKLGTAAFTARLLDEGTEALDSLEIARREERLGADISASAGLDSSRVYLNALVSELDPSLALFADVVRKPAFRDADIERVRGQWIAGIAQEKAQPIGLALRTLPPLLYGEGHAYAIPFTGTGTEASIASLTANDLADFHRDWLRPDNAKILVAGDTTLAAIVPKLDAAFGDWTAPSNPKPTKNIGTVALQKKPRVFLIDRKNSQQTLILAGTLAPPTKTPDNLEIETMNSAFGGTFTSRINMNLREEKHWAYGAGSVLSNAIGQRAFIVYAPVQTDKSAESAAELLKESRAIASARPLTHEEIEKIKLGDVRGLPGEYQTTAAVLASMTNIELYDRPDDYVQTLKRRIDALRDDAVQKTAGELIKADTFTWVIVGDLAKIEQPIRKLELGDITIVDDNGKPKH